MPSGSGNQMAIRLLSIALFLLGTVGWGQGSIGPIVFARGEANVEPVDPGDSFPAGIGTVYAFTEFENLTASDVLSAVWFQGEEAFLSQATTLSELLGATGPVPTGKVFFSLVFYDGGEPGQYRLELSLNSRVVQTREFTIEEAVAEEEGPGAGISAAAAAIQPAPMVAEEIAGEESAELIGSFDLPGVAARAVPGESISTLHHYPETLTDPQLVFAYRDVQPGALWSWSLSREGLLLAEQPDLPWKDQGEGLHVQPLGMELDEGVYDVDLYLDGVRVASSSVTVGAPVPEPGRMLFSDEFDDVNSGWGTATGSNGMIEYREGRLLFTLSGSNAPAVSTHAGIFGDVIAEVEATTMGGPLDNALGIVARYQDNDNYYAFLVSADGYYSILHFIDGQPIWDQQWEFDGLTGIQMGMASNRLKVLAQRQMLRFYVNGRLRGVVGDPLWQEGQMGVFAGVFEEPGVQVGFDEWRLWSLPNE